MRILYDGQIYASQRAGGVNRYFANLIGRLPVGYHPYLTTVAGSDLHFPYHPNLKIYRYRRFAPAALSYRLEKYFFDLVEAGLKFDLVHPTYYTLLTRREMTSYRQPVVLTVWDMIHELFPEVDPTGLHREAKRKAVAAAQAIICISENTRQDLLERYHTPEERVTVTHLASTLTASSARAGAPIPARPYFLHVGERAGYKNFHNLLSAFAKVSASQDVSLCVVGRPFSVQELQRIAALGVADRVDHFGYVDDGHLAKLYSHSVAFVYPSLYEGFGIPLLEAMSCGTVVVASNLSSIPEVVGNAGLLFDPEKHDEITDILSNLVRNPESREVLIARGRERARHFTWERTVSQTIDVYQSVIR
jgi:glycosyltransferase involved in cell wall biosynthesis